MDDIAPAPSKLLEEDPAAIRKTAERAADGLTGWAAFAAVMNELARYGYTLTRESWPNRQMNSIIQQWHDGPDGI